MLLADAKATTSTIPLTVRSIASTSNLVRITVSGYFSFCLGSKIRTSGSTVRRELRSVVSKLGNARSSGSRHFLSFCAPRGQMA